MQPTSYIVFEQYELVVLDAGLDFTLDIGRGKITALTFRSLRWMSKD